MIRTAIRKLLQKTGYDIVKYHPDFVMGKWDEKHLEKEFEWLRSFQFQTIFDIGANEGQFAEKIHILFPQALIYSFEPIPEAYNKLVQNFKDTDRIIGINIAVGDETGELEFHKNEYSASSSVLKLSQNHVTNFDYAAQTVPTKVSVDTLDRIMSGRKMTSPILVKIDVQGYEDKVIAGGRDLLSRADMVITEVSFAELYQGQPLFDDIYRQLRGLGFEYAGSIEQLRSPKTNVILQADAIFIRK